MITFIPVFPPKFVLYVKIVKQLEQRFDENGYIVLGNSILTSLSDTIFLILYGRENMKFVDIVVL